MQKGHLGKRTIMILPRKEAVLLLTVTRTFLCNVLSQFEWQPFMVVVSLNNTFNTNLSIFYQLLFQGMRITWWRLWHCWYSITNLEKFYWN